MTKYTPSKRERQHDAGDWLDDHALAQLRGLSVRDADELLIERAEQPQHFASRRRFDHRVCDQPLQEALPHSDDELDNPDKERDVPEFCAAQTVHDLRRAAERESRERTRIDAQSQQALRRLHAPRMPHSPQPLSNGKSARLAPLHSRRRDRYPHWRWKPARRLDANTPQSGVRVSTGAGPNTSAQQRRVTHDSAQ